VNPFRLDRSQALTADQEHSYLPEQQAVHNGLMVKHQTPASFTLTRSPAS
jgi:hypothetical protein